jgi:hypothetical protein
MFNTDPKYYTDKNGNFDVVSFASIMEESRQFKDFRDLMGRDKRINTANVYINSDEE